MRPNAAALALRACAQRPLGGRATPSRLRLMCHTLCKHPYIRLCLGRGDFKWLFKNKVSIQLQVPLQLPCYNFIRITLHRFEESAVLTYVLNDGSSPSTA